ncbi:unnamed protein product [Mytilus edulis]|uniref:Uncharacterized protein n=1 Tax=Mytilus edulis TaxID=6550 RepID=A0A8S3R5H2_MYTED|nr:unnamed protein product [Mytilus edulis]
MLIHHTGNKLCDDIDIANTKDVANFYSNLAGNFEGVVQYNKDNRDFEGADGTNITVDTLCNLMEEVGRVDPINRYAAVNTLMLTTYSEKCMDFSNKNMIDDLTKTDWNSSAAKGDLKDQPFTGFHLNFSIQQCVDIFGAKFNADLIQKGINKTNTNYGAYAMKPTKLVFPNGSIDPWHALSFTTTSADQHFTTIYIDDDTIVFLTISSLTDCLTLQLNLKKIGQLEQEWFRYAHCANMYPSTPADPPQLTESRKTINTLIGQWLTT